MTTYKTMTNAAAILSLWVAGARPLAQAQSDASLPPAIAVLSLDKGRNVPRLIAQARPTGVAAAALAARKLAQEEQTMPADAAPFEDGAALVLNLKPLYRLIFATLPADHARYPSFLGRQVIDGVPLYIEGNLTLYGKLLAERGQGDMRLNPRVIRSVRVNRAFEELHLLHAGGWGDVEGATIAIITLHYQDGTTADLPIVYGVHVRGGGRGLSEENETLTDPQSKIIWRGPGPGTEEMRPTARLFKSTLINPHPEKQVDTLDLKSAGEPLDSYTLIAATVTLRDPNRPVTPPLPLEPSRNFDGQLVVRVIDATSHQPVQNAVVIPSLNIQGMYLVSSPLQTSETGVAIIRFPTISTTQISVQAKKGGSTIGWKDWQPGVTTITLQLSLPSAHR